MPRKPKQPCAYPGCPKLSDERYCEVHRKWMAKQYSSYKRSPDSNKKYGRSWREVRERYVAAHPLCERCLQDGRLTPVEEVHHIKPVSQGGTNDPSNLMSLCQSCHTKIHFEMGDRKF